MYDSTPLPSMTSLPPLPSLALLLPGSSLSLAGGQVEVATASTSLTLMAGPAGPRLLALLLRAR